MKKLVLSVLAAGLLLPSMALTASADYYDCNWQIHEGDPEAGVCHMYVKPEDRRVNTLTPSGSSGRTTNNGSTNTLTPSGSSGRQTNDGVHTLSPSGSSGRTTDDNNNGVNTLSPSGSSGRTTNENDSDKDVNVLSPSGSASDARGDDFTYTESDENDYYKEYYRKNVRDYCVRDVCYVLYDWCYDETHCEAKKDTIPRDEYDPNYDSSDPNYSRNRNNTWNYWINYYINNYYYGMPMCDSRYQKCVYRGYHFGGYHNGYWPAYNYGY